MHQLSVNKLYRDPNSSKSAQTEVKRLLLRSVWGATLYLRWEHFHNSLERMILCKKRPHNKRVIGFSWLPWQQTAAETKRLWCSDSICAGNVVRKTVCIPLLLLFTPGRIISNKLVLWLILILLLLCLFIYDANYKTQVHLLDKIVYNLMWRPCQQYL